MPKRNDIHKVLIIGSGPIIIGQACEFDYSGTQACKALKSLGYEIVLVNSNPATIMTDPSTADVTYIEPLNVDRLTEIIAKERPDALLPNLGGQSGLNLCEELYHAGVLDKYHVEVIGVQVDAISRGEDRIEFKNTMNKLGIEMAKSAPAYSVEEAVKIAGELGYPCVIRPAYTMGGTGGGIVYNEEELRKVAARGIAASMVNQILIEESVIGWEELEVEVVRDAKGQKISVCFIENIDPMGVHTGDSFCAAPMLTISQDVQDELEKQAHAIVESIGVIGGTNVQFAHDPKTGRIIIIEINPRTSRSSALASKATGFPIAYVSALLAAGLTLDEIPYWKEGTLEKYKPSGDYVVIKFARWAFEKFKGSQDKLGTQMKAVGEVMSIGKNYKEALQKAIRSLEKGRYGLGFASDFHSLSLEELYLRLAEPTSERQFLLYEAIRKGASLEKLHDMTHIKMWFLEQMKELVDLEEEILKYQDKELPDDLLIQAKKDGFSDRYLAQILHTDEWNLFKRRESLGLSQRWDAVPVSAVKEPASYYYSTYIGEDKASVSDGRKVMVLGLLVAAVPGEAPLVAGEQQFLLLFHTAGEGTAALHGHLDAQRGELPRRNAVVPHLGRRCAVKPLKGPRKAVRTLIAVFGRNIHHPAVPGRQFRRGLGQTAAADIFAQGVSAENVKHPLKVKYGRTALLGDGLVAHRFGEMFFNVVNGGLYGGDPVHNSVLLSGCLKMKRVASKQRAP